MNCFGDLLNELFKLFDVIKFRKNLLFIIEDEKGRKFGGYVNAEITKSHEWIYDEHAFVFTLVNNDKIEPEMFPCKDPSHAFMSSDRNTQNFLLLMGGQDNPFAGEDITLRKSDNVEASYCHQGCYEYTKSKDSLIGERTFYMKRLVVVQMVDDEKLSGCN